MKTSAIKIIQSFLNGKNINNLKKFINTRNLVIGTIVIIVIITLSYLLRPVFFNYELNKEIFERKINIYLGIQTKIKGDISYYFFPRPKIVVRDLELNFKDSNKRPITLKESNFLISVSKLKSLNEIQINKAYVKNQRVKIFTSQFKSYLEYFQNYNTNSLILKNCEIFFTDNQDNEISFTDFNLQNTLRKGKEKISITGIFSKNKFKINFTNKENEKKFLNFSIPGVNIYLKAIFNKDSYLEKTSGNLILKFLNNILLLNFDGDEIYKISESFFRNKFLNSKLDGTINFKNNFYFDLNLKINQINMRKFFLYLDSFNEDGSSGQFNISKKINGEVNINLKKTDSFIGKIEKTNFVLLFENGNLKIRSGSANFGKNGKFKFNVSLLGTGKDRIIIFFINFLSNEGKKIIKKFNLNVEEEEEVSFNAVGKINVMGKKIKFDNLIVNGEKLAGRNLNTIENLFNKNIIEDNVLGFLDFFKVKNFLSEASENLE